VVVGWLCLTLVVQTTATITAVRSTANYSTILCPPTTTLNIHLPPTATRLETTFPAYTRHIPTGCWSRLTRPISLQTSPLDPPMNAVVLHHDLRPPLAGDLDRTHTVYTRYCDHFAFKTGTEYCNKYDCLSVCLSSCLPQNALVPELQIYVKFIEFCILHGSVPQVLRGWSHNGQCGMPSTGCGYK